MPFYLGRKAIRKVPGAVIKAAPIPKPELIEGFGTRERVGEVCAEAGFASVLLITDDTLYALGLHEKIAASLEEQGIRYSVFHEIRSEPTPETCLWCCADWLYNEPEVPSYLADAEKMRRMGRIRIYGTALTRKWMDILGVQKHYVTKDGTQRIEL